MKHQQPISGYFLFLKNPSPSYKKKQQPGRFMLKSFVSFFCIFWTFTLSLFAVSEGTVQGTVTDALTGLPLNQVQITIYKNNQIHAQTTTNGVGFYTITTTPDKKYVIVASLAGYQTQSQGLIIEKNQTTTANFTLQPNPGGLRVTTQDDSSNLIDGATVTVYQNNLPIATGTTGSQGQILFSTLAPGSYTVIASKENYATTLGQAIINSGSTTNLTLTMALQHGTLAGNVKGDGLNLQSALIELLLNDVLIASTQTDVIGNYEIQDIHPNTYTVHAHIAGYGAGIQGATITANNTTTVNFALSSIHGSVSGNVQSSVGGNLSGVTIEVLQNNVLISSTLTDFQGNYFINSLDPGSYILHAHDPGYASGISGLTIYDQQTSIVNFVLDPELCSLSGNVSNTVPSPLASAIVEINQDNIILFTTFTDPSGNYLFQGVAPGNYVIHAHDAGYASGIQSKTLISGTNTQDFALQSTSAGSLQGTVKDKNGTPIPGAIVELNLNNVTVYSAVSGDDGSYNFPSIPYNSYLLHCHQPLFQTGITTLSIESSATTYNFVLEELPSSIQGVVNAHSSGSPIQGALIIFYYNGSYINTAVSGPDGLYNQPGLPPGNYQMFVSAPGFIPAKLNLSLGFSQILKQNFVLYSTAAVTGGKAILSLNRYALQTQRVYLLSWQPSTDPAVKSYDIYRNSQKIAHLSTTNSPTYQDKTPPNSIVYYYKIVSLDAQNQPIGELNVYPQ